MNGEPIRNDNEAQVEEKPTEQQKQAQEKVSKNPRQLSRGVKIGRNDKCSCGSGLKYKKCCLRRMEAQVARRKSIAEEVHELMERTQEQGQEAPKVQEESTETTPQP